MLTGAIMDATTTTVMTVAGRSNTMRPANQAQARPSPSSVTGRRFTNPRTAKTIQKPTNIPAAPVPLAVALQKPAPIPNTMKPIKIVNSPVITLHVASNGERGGGCISLPVASASVGPLLV